MENTAIPSTEETKEQTAPTLERIAELNSLDKEFLDYTKGNLSVDPEASFKWLDDWSERRFGIRGEKGSAWLGNRKEYPNPNAYADALTGLVTRGYEAIATPEYNAYIAAEKSGNREEMIKAAGISLTKRGEYVSADGLPIGSQDIPKTDEEIDNELNEYGRKIKLQNFSAHFLTFADDFTPDEKEIVYASLRYGDGLPAENEADYLAVWRDNPEKAARLHYLVELSRKNESAWMHDNLVHPFMTGIANIRYGIGDELGDFAEFQGAISAMKEVVSRDGERLMWNAAERKLFRDLEARKATRQMELNRRGLGNSATFQTFTSAADEGVANPKAYVDEICARRMAREALPREEQLKRRKEELMLRLATSHKPYDNYDPISNAISGAIGTIPYMAVAAVPYAGIAINTLAQFGNVRNDIIMNGGNPDDGIGTQFLLAAGWSAIEKQQFLTFTKPLTGLQKKAILERIAQTAWKNGKLGALGSAIRQGTPEFVAKTFAECVEEGLQGAVEGGTKQWWMPEEKGGGDWRKTISAALTQGGKDFVDSIGTMGLLSLAGGGLNQTQARRNALSVESLVDYGGKRLQVMNILTGRVKEMVDEKNIPANAQKMHNEVVQMWEAHKGNAVAALDEMREKYGLTDDQARTIGDYLDLRSTLLNIARTSKTDEEADTIAAFAGGAYRVGQTTGMGDTAYDVTDLFRMISPNITVEDIEVDDTAKAPVASPAVENLRQERDAAIKRIEEAKVGSQRKAAERELRRINKRLKAAETKENAVSYPKMTMRRVTIPVGKNGETRSFVIREDNEVPDIHSAGYAISISDAVRGSEGAKDGRKVSLAEFKSLSKEDKKRIAVTPEQYMAMTNEEREDYVSGWGLGGSGSFSLLDENNREIFNSDAIVKLFRGKLGTPGARIGGNWTLAHEYTHGVVRFLRDIGAIDEGTVALMQKLFGAPVAKDELWNEEAMANGFAEFLRGEFDFRRLTPEERREAMGFFERVWDIIKDFFRRIFGKEIDEPPVVANIRKEAERAVFNAIRNGDLSGLDQYAGIEFEEEKREEGKGKREEVAQDTQKQPSTPFVEETANEPPKTEKRAPRASTPSNTTKDASKEPAKTETTPTTTATTDVTAVVEQIENPIATAANLPARTNTKMTIFTPGYEMEIECEMMWVPLGELAESTDDREVQMRDRSRRATDEQVRTKTRKGVFQPLALFPGNKSDDGAPIVGGGMKIISGHGRKRMLEQLAAEGRFNEYLSAINAEAQRKGVPTAPEGMKNPVLVLRVTGGLDKKSDLNRFAELSNRWGGLERSGAELAESDARKITDALLRLYNPDSSGNLLAASNRQFMAAFLKEVGATGLTNADGTPTPEAALRVQRALMTAIFGNDEKIRAIIQNLLEKSGELSLGNLQNALMRSAGKLLAMKRAKGSFDIVNDVREAAYHYIAWRSAQQKQKSLSFADFLNEQDMFTAGATPMQATLAKLLEVGRFGTVLDEYSKLVAQEAVDAQGTFDFAEKRTPLQLLGYAERNTLAAEETPVTPDPASAEARLSVTNAQAQREYDDVVSRFTKADGTKKPGWMKAPNGKPSNLTERQWVQVRTPSFKKWFGDWENIELQNWLENSSVATATGKEYADLPKAELEDAIVSYFANKGIRSVENENVGKVNITRSGIHDSIAKGVGRMKIAAFNHLPEIISNGRVVARETNWKERGYNTVTLAAPIEIENKKHVALVTIRQYPNHDNNFYLHEVGLLDEIKREAERLYDTGLSQNGDKEARPLGSMRNIAQSLFAVNPSSASKVVDENGEPLVVWHGSTWDPMSEPNGKAVFDKSRINEGALGRVFYFSRTPTDQYGRNVTAAYLSIKNPFDVQRDAERILSREESDRFYKALDGEAFGEYKPETMGELFAAFKDEVNFPEAMKAIGYDGVIDNTRGYIGAFDANQIKSATDNTGAFDGTNADIRFSITAPVERSKNLIALHNLKPSDLAAAAELEGMPAPSIAVVKDSMVHDNYGPISFVFGAGVIDPKGDRNNKIYSSDAWTPTRGSVNIEYKVLDEKLDEIIASLINAGDENYRKLFKAFSERGSLGDIAENAIAAGEYYRLWHNDAILLSYLNSKGQSVPLSYREQAISHNYSNAVVKGVGDAVGDKIAEIWENGGKTGDEEAVERMSEIMRPAAVKAKDDENPEGAAERRAKGVPTLGERLYGEALKRPWNLAKAVMQYREHGITQEIDTFAVSKTMNEMLSTDDPAYQEWVSKTFAPAVGAKGIRNKLDVFTPRGNRRSWEALHDEVTAQRIVDMMYHNSKEVGGNGFGGYNPEGAAVRTYASITEMRRDRDRLKVMPEEEWKKLHDEARKDMIDAVSRLQSKQKGFYSDNSFIELDTIKDIVLQAWIDAKGNKAKYLSICKDELHVYDESDCSDIWDVMMRLRNAPTKYFEAKPERVVGFDEVAFAVIPDDSTAETVDILKTRGIETHTYKAEDKEDRLRVLNEAANASNIRFSVGGVYTGSAADYEKPSLHYVGSGEGAQVYGWGLYASTVRGVAEGYAERDVQDKKFEGNNIIFKGKRVDFEEIDKWPEDQKLALLALSKQEGDVFSAKLTLKKGIFGNNILDRSKADRALAWLERNESDIEKARPNLYEQTFFTDRAPGDESHLLKWYEPVSEEQLDWIMAQAEKEGLVDKFENNKRWLNFKGSFKQYILDNGSSADAIYEQLSNSGIAHSDNKYRDTSEFLARAGIDGVKYPVDSYGGKGVKDGDEAGWNYVSFRDDNIRVDHKWVDGEQRFSIATLGKYRTDDLRSLAHRVKDGDAEAIAEAGRRLAVIMPPDAVLVPMPSHTGEPTTMRLLADAIAANANGAKVVDALRSNAHESNYAQKKRGEEPAEIEMRKVADIPENAEVYIVDNVIDTGATYSAAMKAIPNAHILALADTDRTPREKLSMTRSIAEIDAQDGTNLQGIGKLVAEVKERGEKPRGRQGHFNLSKTPEFLKNILSGEYFTVKAGVILDHFGKDPDHSLTIEDWAKISEALHDPLVIAKYSFINKTGKRYYPPKSYRIWVEAVINGHWAVVGVEVKSPSRNIDVNAVETVYGDERISLNPEDIVYSRNNEEGIRTLLGGPNSHEYSESPSTTHIISNSLPENNGRGRPPEERHHVRAFRKTYIGDVVEAYVASQRLAGADVSVEDVNALLKNVGLRHTTPQEVIDAADKLVQTDKAKANALINRNLPELVEYVRRTNMEGELNKALSDAVTMGAKAANPETGRKLQQAIERKRIRDLQSAEGFTAAEIMAELPISLADGVLATAELERTPEELARIEEAQKKREEERLKALETEEGAEELADPETPMREPTEAERKAVDDLLDRARMRDDLAKQEEERRRAEKAKRDAADGDGDSESDAGDDAADDMPLMPEETVRRIAPVFESADVFSWFIIELTGDKTLDKHPELPSTGEMWKSPVAVRELKKTAADILRRLAKDTLGSPSINYARNLVDRAINELESDIETKTFNSVRHKIAHIYEMIWDNAHRISKNELMEELEKTVSKLTQKGRFSYTQEEMERDIPAKIERWARWVRDYAKMGEAKLQKEIANLENLTSMNPKSENGKPPTPIELAEAPDKLAVAKVYGHLKGKTIGEMRDLIDQIASKLDGERQAFELRRAKIEEANKTIVDALVNALTQGKANRRKRAKAQSKIDRAMAAMISSIDQQMVDLVRFCTDPELRKKALEAIDELTILINEGGNRYRNTLATAQEEIHDGLKACYGDAAKGIRHLHEELPPEIVEQFFRQSSDKPRTYGHLLQLYASCLQRDYAENIHKHGRDEQIAAMEAALTAQDKMFHTWAVNWYKHNREALSAAVEEVTGLPVIAPDELYVPVRVETEPSGIPAEVVAWSPIPSALNRRVRHGLDFDENAHFLTMLNEQAETRAQTIGYAMTGIILRDTIASRDVQTAARRNASPSDMNAVILHLLDILAQGAGQEKSVLESLKVLRKWAARFNIAWNPSSALAQPASIPVWANVLLDGKAWGAMSVLEAMSTAATEEGRAAIAELRASDGYRARYKLGWSEEVANVYANPNEPKLLSKLGAAYDKGMILSQFTDAACSLWIAQGFYRHATDVFVRRGETIEEAKRKALALTWAAVEQTQQSGRTENLSAIQRGRGKNIINAILQFKTAQILQNSYIIRAIRDVQAGVPGAKGRLARAIFISTVWVPSYLSLKGALWALFMGAKPEPDDEDEMPLWFREMLYSAVDGMTAPLFVTSTMAEAPLRKMLNLRSYGSSTGIAALDTWQKLGNDIFRMMTDPIMLEEELTSEKIIDDIWKVIGDTLAPARHLRRAINNRRED